MRPQIVSPEQQRVFSKKHDAGQQILQIRAALSSIYNEQKNIKAEIDTLLSRHEVLEERSKKLIEEIQNLQTLL